jgi:large exoprotein involved in heme utilization and adhesion
LIRRTHVKINAADIAIANESLITSGSFGQGDSGSIFLNTTSSSIGSVLISGDSTLSSTTREQGRAGLIAIKTNSVLLDNSRILSTVDSDASGNGQEIKIEARNLSLTGGSLISAATYGQGNAGNIMVRNADSVSLSDSLISTGVNQNARGEGGNVDVQTQSLSLTNGGQISASTESQGNAGNIRIDAPNGLVSIQDSSSGLFSQTNSNTGKGGAIAVTTQAFQIGNGATLNATTNSASDGGSITINANTFDAVSGSKLQTTTSGSGNAGNISVNVGDRFFLDGAGTDLLANTAPGSSGNGGSIEINSTNLSINNGASIGINSSGQGSAGRFLNINAGDEISLTNGFITSGLGNQAIGQGGEINLTAGSLSLSNNSQITAQSQGTGNAGNINIDANTLDAVSGGKLQTTTSGSGNAGNISVNVGDRFSLRSADTGLFANTEVGSSGNGGSIFIDPRTVVIENGAGVTVGSQGTGIGGNIQIQADSLKLDSGTLSAETASAQGGNIEIQSEGLLLLRRNSLISTNAGNARQGGNGGNITINSPNGFIVAVPNEDSDISANAFTGSGGRVNITATGIYGIESRPRQTELSDITASSELGVQGTIQINTPLC